MKICATGVYDWIFDGEADWSFPIACQRWFRGDKTLTDIVGLTWRAGPDEPFTDNSDLLSLGDTKPAGTVDDLDAISTTRLGSHRLRSLRQGAELYVAAQGQTLRDHLYVARLPLPVYVLPRHLWKEIPFPLAQNVAAEVKLLSEMGVDELQIVDDIFNMNPPRMKAVCRAIEPFKMHITFPNGLRFDISGRGRMRRTDPSGTYAACVAVETITPRLQELIKKHLRVERTRRRSSGWQPGESWFVAFSCSASRQKRAKKSRQRSISR